MSHCKTRSNREDYVEAMSSIMDITIKGKCSKNYNITKDKLDDTGHDTDGFKDLDQYYFYLSFENSLCDQYITEKLFRILFSESYVVPVVMGAPKKERHHIFQPYLYTNYNEVFCSIYLCHLTKYTFLFA